MTSKQSLQIELYKHNIFVGGLKDDLDSTLKLQEFYSGFSVCYETFSRLSLNPGTENVLSTFTNISHNHLNSCALCSRTKNVFIEKAHEEFMKEDVILNNIPSCVTMFKSYLKQTVKELTSELIGKRIYLSGNKNDMSATLVLNNMYQNSQITVCDKTFQEILKNEFQYLTSYPYWEEFMRILKNVIEVKNCKCVFCMRSYTNILKEVKVVKRKIYNKCSICLKVFSREPIVFTPIGRLTSSKYINIYCSRECIENDGFVFYNDCYYVPLVIEQNFIKDAIKPHLDTINKIYLEGDFTDKSLYPFKEIYYFYDQLVGRNFPLSPVNQLVVAKKIKEKSPDVIIVVKNFNKNIVLNLETIGKVRQEDLRPNFDAFNFVEKRYTIESVENIFQTLNLPLMKDTTILKCFKISSDFLLSQFERKKEEFFQQGISTETKLVFHGCYEYSTVHNILDEGFREQYSQVELYGKGIYFSTDPNYCVVGNYCAKLEHEVYSLTVKHIFICAILPGNTIVGKSKMRLPPFKPQTQHRYNSFINKEIQPSIYACSSGEQTLPLYSVYFL